MTRSTDFLIAILGVLLAGGVALPIDPTLPPTRIEEITRDARPRLCLLGGQPSKPERVNIKVVDNPAGERPLTCGPTAAYILYTSGSTGVPKGVVLSHTATTSYAQKFAAEIALVPDDRVGWRSPVSVDAALFEIVLAAAAGAVLVALPSEASLSPELMTECVRGYQVSVLVLVPSLLSLHLYDEGFRSMPSLRIMASVGEQLTGEVAAEFREQNTARLYNLYGPTEAGIGVTAFELGQLHVGPVPIGGPLGDVVLHVLGDKGDPVDDGDVGELVVGGGQLALGYLQRGDLTAAAFKPDHLSGVTGGYLYHTGDLVRVGKGGVLAFVGRRDDQVKINGIRVELGEIEQEIGRYRGVKSVAVLAEKTASGSRVLIAYIAWVAAGDQQAEHLRAHLRRILPPAFIPRKLVAVPVLPLLANGKVDRAALAAAG